MFGRCQKSQHEQVDGEDNSKVKHEVAELEIQCDCYILMSEKDELWKGRTKLQEKGKKWTRRRGISTERRRKDMKN